ncbi:MAG: acyl-CoA dehydrogenase, partial [archaeon]|nr:acyl-CoA dehydrogenase [archaeon]
AGRELAAKDFSCLDSLQALMYHRALIAVSAAGYEMQSRLQAGELLDDARNHTALAFFNAVRAHTYAFMLEHFAGAVRSAEAFDPACAAALRRLCVLFAVANIIDDQWAGVLTHEQVQMARICASKTMAEIRPDIIPLTDAFDLPDHVLLSAIGRHDGNVYEALYTSATRCPLNKDQVFDGYKEYLQPHLDLEGLLQVKNQRSKL